MQPNRWAEFVATTKDFAHWPLVERAAALAGRPGHALDLGCGGGRDTRFLLAQGWQVTAVDREPAALAALEPLAGASLQLVQSSFEAFAYPASSYEMVSAQYTLPFIAPPQLPAVFARIRQSLRPGGVLTCQFFGPNDTWNTPERPMTFLDRGQVDALLEGLSVHVLDERQELGATALGDTKHWHIFDVIAQDGSDYHSPHPLAPLSHKGRGG